MRWQQGFGLTELIITTALASLIMLALMQAYLHGKQSYLQAQALLERELELQLVSDFMRDSIRRAGFTPCLAIQHLQTIDRRQGRTTLRAVESAVGRDQALHLNRMSEYFSSVARILSPRQLLIAPGQAYHLKQAILIADCYHAEVQLIRSVQSHAQGLLLELSQPLAADYVAPIYVGEWIEEAFFVRKNKQGKSALFYQSNHAEELSALINQFSSALKLQQGRMFLTLDLGLDKGQRFTIEAAVRAP